MKILFLAAEVAPFVSIGGLSQVMYFLPRSLISLKDDVHIFTPKYGNMRPFSPEEKEWKFETEKEHLVVPIDPNVTDDEKMGTFLECNVKRYNIKKTEPVVHLLENKEYYETRANVFGYADDHVRFALLSKGCLEWLRLLKQQKDETGEGWFPDIIHCNDWHTCYFIQHARLDKRYKNMMAKTPILLTVHNFHFQGNMQFRYLSSEEKDNKKNELVSLLSEKLIHQNALLRGIYYADSVNTVSPTHALEVMTPEYGEGLDEDLQKIKGKVTGILNGIDTNEFNPAKDLIVKKKYSKRTVSELRKYNKLDLQKTFLLPEDYHKVILVTSGRLTSQKGWDLLIQALPHVLLYDENIQLIVLGDGEDRYKEQLHQLKQQFPNRIGLHLRSDFRLPRKLFAGGDIILMPSKFEPGGIVALEALRYGVVPLVRKTGGLTDIVNDFNSSNAEGNGFSFKEKDPWVLFGTIIKAITIYHQKYLWNQLVQNGMESDFSWLHAAKEYDRLYRNIITEKKRALSLTPHPAYKSV